MNLLDALVCLVLIEDLISGQTLPPDEDNKICGVEDTNKTFVSLSIKPHVRQSRRNPILELGVFYEPYLRDKFNNDDNQLKNYLKIILSGAQTVFNYPSMRTRIKLVVNRFEMIPSGLVSRSNDPYVYIENFCRWQWNNFGSQRNYDLGLFLVRTNQYVTRRGTTKIVEGLANMPSVCFPEAVNKSCVLANVSFLDSMWIIPHEIMHTFGIKHLTANCGQGIMHWRGHGHFEWSDCTNNAFEGFLAQTQNSECLFNSVGTPLGEWDLSAFPFHSYSMDEQCSVNFGLKYSGHYFYSNECRRLVCTYDLLATIQAASVLEGTKCGNSQMGWGSCVGGKCLVSSQG